MTEKIQNQNRIFSLAHLAKVAGVALDVGASALGFQSSSSFRGDSFHNPLTGLNTARDKVTHSRVKPPETLSDQEISDLYRGNVFARRVCKALPGISLRQGIRLRHPNAGDLDADKAAEDVKTLAKALKKFSVIQSVREADTWGRAYGRGAILLGVSGAGRPSMPYDPEVNPGKLEFITVLEKRDFSVAEVHPDTGLPMLWRLNLPEGPKGKGDVLIHDSRLLMFGADLTSARERLRNQYADDSVLLSAYEPLRGLDTTWNSTVHLVADASQGVFTVKGFFEMLTSGNVDALLLRLQMMDMSRSSVRGVVVDAEDEKFERTTTNFSGLPEVLQSAFQIAAAAAEMPVTELMGMSPAGLNATGESDTRSWYAKAEEHQTGVLLDPLELLVNLVALASGLPSGWVVEFPSLWTMNPMEQATYRKTVAETDKIEIDGGVLLAEEVAVHRHSGNADAWDTPVPIDLTIRAAVVEAQLRKMEEDATKPDPEPPTDENGNPIPPPPPGAPTPEEGDQKPAEEDAVVENGAGKEEAAAAPTAGKEKAKPDPKAGKNAKAPTKAKR